MEWTENMFEDMETKKIIIPDGWEFDKVENGDIILKKIKDELPETWSKCYDKIKKYDYIDSFGNVATFDAIDAIYKYKNVLPVGLGKPMLALMQLLVCREVCRQGWKPNWKDSSDKYIIENYHNHLHKECYSNIARILSFQSVEIRNKFLENFRDLIEEAKELI